MIRDDILLSPYARKLVRFKARCMALQPAFSNENAEDLAQELTVRLFHGLSCFDSEKGHPNLLVATIVGRSAAELIRSRVL